MISAKLGLHRIDRRHREQGIENRRVVEGRMLPLTSRRSNMTFSSTFAAERKFARIVFDVYLSSLLQVANDKRAARPYYNVRAGALLTSSKRFVANMAFERSGTRRWAGHCIRRDEVGCSSSRPNKLSNCCSPKFMSSFCLIYHHGVLYTQLSATLSSYRLVDSSAASPGLPCSLEG